MKWFALLVFASVATLVGAGHAQSLACSWITAVYSFAANGSVDTISPVSSQVGSTFISVMTPGSTAVDPIFTVDTSSRTVSTTLVPITTRPITSVVSSSGGTRTTTVSEVVVSPSVVTSSTSSASSTGGISYSSTTALTSALITNSTSTTGTAAAPTSTSNSTTSQTSSNSETSTSTTSTSTTSTSTSATPSCATNLVSNGGFDNGGLAGWDVEFPSANWTGGSISLNSQNRGPYRADTPPEFIWGYWIPTYNATSSPLLLLSHAGIPISNGQRVHASVRIRMPPVFLDPSYALQLSLIVGGSTCVTQVMPGQRGGYFTLSCDNVAVTAQMASAGSIALLVMATSTPLPDNIVMNVDSFALVDQSVAGLALCP